MIFDYQIIYTFIVLAILFVLSGIVSGSEVALFSLTKADLEEPTDKEKKRVKIISDLLDKPKKLLATILIANNIINIAIIIQFYQIGEVLFNDLSAAIAIQISDMAIGIGWSQPGQIVIEDVSSMVRFFIEIVVITFFILFFGEVLPKIYANRNKYKYSLLVSYPVYIADIIFSPLSNPMRYFTSKIQEQLKGQKNNLSVDQLSQALELTSITDTSHQEQKILKGIVSFGNTDASQVMRPRIDVFSLSIEESYQEVLTKIKEKGYSRIPVYKENIDHVEGVLFVKDLIPHLEKTNFDWAKLIRTPLFVPENKKLDDLLKFFQTTKNHLAIVVDEFGGTSGLISLEDIIEEIVGNISDEFDDVLVSHSKIDDNNYVFEGKTSLKDFYRVLSIDEELFEAYKGEAETLAGFILQVNKNFPKRGQKILFDQYLFTILGLDNRRVKRIKVTLK